MFICQTEGQLLKRFGRLNSHPNNLQVKHIAIFASGEGSNAENIILYFKSHPHIKVVCVISNVPDAPVMQRAQKLNVETRLFSAKDFADGRTILDFLQRRNIDLVVLAGFLKLVPENIIRAYQKRIINIHPALLPKFGGKGMYGIRVHRAVLNSGEKETGITIHYVNEHFDEGEIIFQKKINIDSNESPETVMQKVRTLEMEFYPKVIEELNIFSKK